MLMDWNVFRKILLTVLCCLFAVFSRSALMITSPLFLDYFKPLNSTHHNRTPANPHTSEGNTVTFHDVNVVNNSLENYKIKTLNSTLAVPFNPRVGVSRLANNVKDNEETITFTTVSHGNCSSDDSYKGISIVFLIVCQFGLAVIFYGFILIIYVIFLPHKIGQVEKQASKFGFAKIGFAAGVSSLLFNYSISGQRTAPYLQSILANCNIPIQFVMRFIILRKKPTLIKIVCAITIILAELVCLLPTIFPSLEASSAHKENGGASGPGRILWPLCMISSMVPFAVANTLTEKSVQNELTNIQEKEETSLNSSEQSSKSTLKLKKDISKINLIYFQFWWSLFLLVSVVAFFWTEIIPHFGTSENLHEFWKRFKFDFMCLFGQADCPSNVIVLGWMNFVISVFAGFSLPALMRYSEGANFVVIVLTLRTPLVFLFWSLFDERPFLLHPHAGLATYLSIASICVMLPAVVIYDMGDSWYEKYKQNKQIKKPLDDIQKLLGDGEEYITDVPYDINNTGVPYDINNTGVPYDINNEDFIT